MSTLKKMPLKLPDSSQAVSARLNILAELSNIC